VIAKGNRVNRPQREFWPLSGGSAVVSALTRVAGVLAGLTFLALAAGYSGEQSYFRHLGAPWAVTMLTPTHLVQMGAFWVLTCFLWVLAGLSCSMNDSSGRLPRLFWFAALLGFAITSAFSILGLAADVDLVPPPTSAVSFSKAVIATFAASFSVLAVMSIRPYTALTGRVVFMSVVGMNLIGGLFIAPSSHAHYRALKALNPATTSLVTIVTTTPAQKWYLVLPLEKGFLLMSGADNYNGRMFKVVNSESVELRALRAR
jgi:hypothetical protein